MIEPKLFDEWNSVKKRLQFRHNVRYFKERQIWWCGIGQNLGSETYGKGRTFSRPVLILKKLSSDLFLGVPLTSKQKEGSWYVKFRHKGITMSALFSQVRIFDRRRLLNKFGELDDSNFSEIKTGFNRLYCL